MYYLNFLEPTAKTLETRPSTINKDFTFYPFDLVLDPRSSPLVPCSLFFDPCSLYLIFHLNSTRFSLQLVPLILNP